MIMSPVKVMTTVNSFVSSKYICVCLAGWLAVLCIIQQCHKGVARKNTFKVLVKIIRDGE